MGIFETFSNRRALQVSAGKSDVYVFDEIPPKLRVQLVHIFKDALGTARQSSKIFPYGSHDDWWAQIRSMLIRERGVFFLQDQYATSDFDDCIKFILNGDVEGVLDIVELCLKCVDIVVREKLHDGSVCDPVIIECNYRFRENSVGYQYEGKQLIQVDSQYIHSEVVKTALQLLHDKAFAGAEKEFLDAHKQYREGDYSESMVSALKSFESTIKCIGAARGWGLDAKLTACKLIEACISNQLVPTSLSAEFSSLRSLMESGIPTLRNSHAGHGQGPTIRKVPEHLAAFALHLCASHLVFLVRSHKS